jgi:hypothetical protein
VGNYPITAAVGTLSAANYSFNFVNGTLTVVTPPTASLTNTSALTGSHAGGYTLTINVKNTGTTTVSNLTLTGATLGSTPGTPLPQTWGTLAPGATATFTVAVPGSVGADGAKVAEAYSGSFAGGNFATSLRSVTLP